MKKAPSEKAPSPAKRAAGVAPSTQRSREDLMEAVREQLYFLRASCIAYDLGNYSEGKRIASSLKILLYEASGTNPRRSRALLGLVDLLSVPFFNTAGPLVPRNLASEYPLLMFGSNGNGWRFIPRVWALAHQRWSLTGPNSDFGGPNRLSKIRTWRIFPGTRLSPICGTKMGVVTWMGYCRTITLP